MLAKIDSARTKVLRNGAFSGESVLYWMSRDKRVDDNWALLAAQSVALNNKVPLIVCFQYIGNFPEANIRQYGFQLKGLLELKNKLESLNIEFILSQGRASEVIPRIIDEKVVGTIITDYSPLRVYKKRVSKVLNRTKIPFYQIDAHNIVPVWKASPKKEYAAYTIRKKIHDNLDQFLTDYPSLIKHPYGNIRKDGILYDNIVKGLKIDFSVQEVDWLVPGEIAAKNKLDLLHDSLA